ncbi:MAG TPA: DUF885 domain-containing protein [Cyclobacteriaceae bacterium]|nr:DUF885 domain-containing protein [Cyclobacteriaceae bacterium]
MMTIKPLMRIAQKIALALIFCLSLQCGTTQVKDEEAISQLNAFINEFSSNDEAGPLISDISDAHFAQELAKTKSQLNKLRAIVPERLSGDDLIDWKFAQSILAGRELELSEMQPWKKNPRVYMEFTRISNVIDRPGNVENKIKEIETRLALVPTQLENGTKQLEEFVPRFQELSLFMAENGRVLFEKELPMFIDNAGENAAHLKALNAKAAASLETFIRFLTDELPTKPRGTFAIGEATYNKMLKQQFLTDYDADSLWKFGWERFNATLAELVTVAKKIDPNKHWKQLAYEIKREYPDPDKMIEAHQEWVDKAGEHIKSNDLIPIPWPERVYVVPRVEYLRKTSYYGNFSSAKGLDKDSIFTSEWMINPFEDQWDQQRKDEYLVEHDWGVIIVTAPHETYGGHHVQGLYQLHNPRKLRRDNGISIFSEGWGLYNEQLMEETGFFPNERIHLRQLQLRLWRDARVIYDVGMHTGRLTYDKAINIMTDQVGFLRWAAQLEVDASSARPGYFIGYFMGMSEILKMRDEYKQKMGDKFSLRDFHERLLKIGNMPPSLMREALLAD